MARNLIVRFQVTIDSVRGLLDSLDRGEAGNTWQETARITCHNFETHGRPWERSKCVRLLKLIGGL